MPVITVDGKKVAVPKATTLCEVISKLCTTTDILLNGTRPIKDQIPMPVKDGDIITSNNITFTFQDIYHYTSMKEVKVPTGTKLVDVLPLLLPEVGRYNIIRNGHLNTNDETILKNNDDVLYQKLIPIRLQNCVTYIPEEITIMQLYHMFFWSAKNAPPTVNGKKEQMCYILQEDDVVRISKNH